MSLRNLIGRLACAILLIGATAGSAAGQGAGDIAAPRLPPEQLEQLLAPVALYPDALLAQVLAASTYPMDVVRADRWVQAHRDLSGVDGQDWDPSVKALAQFPTVLKMMDQQLDWTSQLGEAYLNQSQDVLAAVQSLRARARAAGNLQDTPQQQVVVDQGTIQIVPASPQVIYVPSYNPTVVYAPAPGVIVQSPGVAGVVVASGISFGLGVALGSWANLGCDWHHGYVHYGHWGHYGGVNGVRFNSNVNVNRANIYNRNVNANFANVNAGARGLEGQRWARDARRGPPPQAWNRMNQADRLNNFRGRDNLATNRPGQPGANRPGAGEAAARRPGTSQLPAAGSRAGTAFNPSGGAGAVRQSSNRGQASREASKGRTVTPSAQPRRSTPTARTPSAFNPQSSGGAARSFSNRGAASRGTAGGMRGGGGSRGGGRGR